MLPDEVTVLGRKARCEHFAHDPGGGEMPAAFERFNGEWPPSLGLDDKHSVTSTHQLAGCNVRHIASTSSAVHPMAVTDDS